MVTPPTSHHPAPLPSASRWVPRPFVDPAPPPTFRRNVAPWATATENLRWTQQLHRRLAQGTLPSDLAEAAIRVAETAFVDAEFLEHPQVEVAERRVATQIDVAAGGERSSGIARDHDRKVVVVVAGSIRDAAAIDDHGIVQQ